MEICYEQCYVDIGVVKATKWRHFPFHLQPYFSALKVSLFHNWSGKLVPPYLPQCSWSLSETYESFFEVFWDEIFMVRDIVKTGQSWCLNFFRLSFRSCMSRLFNCMWWSSLHLKLVKAKFDMQTIFMILPWNVGVQRNNLTRISKYSFAIIVWSNHGKMEQNTPGFIQGCWLWNDCSASERTGTVCQGQQFVLGNLE